MVNSGYTPRHSAAVAVKSARVQEHTAEPAIARRSALNRVQVIAISATAVALLAAGTYFATRAALGTGPGRPSASQSLTSTPTVRVFGGSRYSLHGPSAILTGGGTWVTNGLSNTVTRIPAGQGKPLTLPASYGFDGPNALAIGGGHVWVANVPGNSIIELKQSSGKLIRQFSTGYGLASPYALLIHGKHLWVANSASNSVTEIGANSGRLLRTISGRPYRFRNPYALAVSAGRLFVANAAGNSVTVLNAATGAWIATLKAGFELDGPTALAA